MVGYPGETDDDFARLLDFIEEVRFDYLGAFRYSPETGTPAAGFGEKIDEPLAEDRLEMLYNVAEEISAEKAQEQIGKKQIMLVEEPAGLEPGGRLPRGPPQLRGVPQPGNLWGAAACGRARDGHAV